MMSVETRDLTGYWTLLEYRYREWRKGLDINQISLPTDFPWTQIDQDYLNDKAKVHRNQDLSRLFPVPVFINASAEEDPNHDPEDRDLAKRVCFRSKVLFWNSLCFQSFPFSPSSLDIIANSAVLEWLVDLGDGRVWDRQPLYLNFGKCAKKKNEKKSEPVEKKPAPKSTRRSTSKSKRAKEIEEGNESEDDDDDSKRKSKPSLQIRFLALEDLFEIHDPNSQMLAEVQLSLHEKKEQIDSPIIGEIHDSAKKEFSPSYKLETKSNDGGHRKTILRAEYDREKRRLAIPIEQLDIQFGGTGNLGKSRHFVIKANVMLVTCWGTLLIGDKANLQDFDLYWDCQANGRGDQLVNVHHCKTGLESKSFILQSNTAKQCHQHYIERAWRLMSDYYVPISIAAPSEPLPANENKRKAPKKENSEFTIPLEHVIRWLAGIVPYHCSKWCRLADAKEQSHLKRLLIFRKVCRAAGYDGVRRTEKANWEKEGKRLEKTLFEGRLLPEKAYNSPRAWVKAMYGLLIDFHGNFPMTLPILKEDLTELRHVICEDLCIDSEPLQVIPEVLEIRLTSCSLITWITQIGRAIDDSKQNLGAESSSIGKSALDMWNEMFLTMRSRERCLSVANEFNKIENPSTIILSFDTMETDSLLLTKTKLNREVYFGREKIGVIGETQRHDFIEGRVEVARGLRAFLSQGYLANYRCIAKIVERPGKRDQAIRCFIYGSDAMDSQQREDVLFKTRPRIIHERCEVNPLFGDIPMRIVNSNQQLISVEDPEFSRALENLSLSNDQPDSENSQEIMEPPCKIGSQSIENVRAVEPIANNDPVITKRSQYFYRRLVSTHNQPDHQQQQTPPCSQIPHRLQSRSDPSMDHATVYDLPLQALHTLPSQQQTFPQTLHSAPAWYPDSFQSEQENHLQPSTSQYNPMPLNHQYHGVPSTPMTGSIGINHYYEVQMNQLPNHQQQHVGPFQPYPQSHPYQPMTHQYLNATMEPADPHHRTNHSRESSSNSSESGLPSDFSPLTPPPPQEFTPHAQSMLNCRYTLQQSPLKRKPSSGYALEIHKF